MLSTRSSVPTEALVHDVDTSDSGRYRKVQGTIVETPLRDHLGDDSFFRLLDDYDIGLL